MRFADRLAQLCSSILVVVCALFSGAHSAFAQLQLDPRPLPTPSPRIQVPPQLQQFQPQPLPFDRLEPPQRAPQRGGVTASAAFDPPILRLMRFGEYRVTISGATSGIEIPDPLPAPEGLILELTEKTPGTSIMSGQRTLSITYRYTVTAARPGTFVVPSFTAHVAGTAVTVPAAQLSVQEPGPADLPYQSASAVLDLQDGDYYVGQMLPARLLVFDTPDEAVQAVANVTKPSGDFLFQSQTGSRRERLVWQGKTRSAMVTPLRLTPIKPGESDISVQAIVFVTRLTSVGRSSGNTAQAMLDTPPVRVRVRPLPEAGRKPGFTGGIGKFELGKPALSATDVAVGDPLTLSVVITGEGNLEAISPPTIDGGDAWQTFTPTVEVDRDAFSGRGSKTITYTLIPRSADVRSVPAIPFSYFDPERAAYVDLSVPPVMVNVKLNSTDAPAPAAEAKAEVSAAPQTESAKSNRPELILTGLAESPGQWRSSPSPMSSRPAFWLAQLIPAVALGGLWFWRRRADYLDAHPEIVRRRVARAAARRHLRRAREAANRSDTETFVHSSIAAIRAAAAPLDSTEADSLVLHEVLVKLPVAEVASDARQTVQRLFERAHAKQFSGHPVEPNGVFSLLPEVERTITTIEKRQP